MKTPRRLRDHRSVLATASVARRSDDVWNYNFMGVQHSPQMSYDLKLATPLSFYDERHRPYHFLNFAAMDRGGDAADVEDPFA